MDNVLTGATRLETQRTIALQVSQRIDQYGAEMDFENFKGNRKVVGCLQRSNILDAKLIMNSGGRGDSC